MFVFVAGPDDGPKQIPIVADSVGNHIYTIGGELPESEDSLMEVYVLDTLVMEWALEEPNEEGERAPSYRSGHSVVAYEDSLYIWGGKNMLETNALYAYNTRTAMWRKIDTETQPDYRCFHSACFYSNRMYIFGGYNLVLQRICDDVHYYDFDTNSWHEVETTGDPPEDGFHNTVAVINHRMYMFVNSKIVYLDLRTNHWETVYNNNFNSLSTICFVYRNKLYALSGDNFIGGSFHDTVCRVDPETFELEHVPLLGPKPRIRWYYKCIVVGTQMVMFGGLLQSEMPNDAITLVLNLAPPLQILALQKAIVNQVDISVLPQLIQRIAEYLTPSKSDSDDFLDCY